MIEEKNIEYNYIDLTKESIDYDTLIEVFNNNEKPLKKYFNTSGVVYKEKNIKNLFENHTDEEMLKLISEDGLLLKRPFIVDEEKVYIGKEYLDSNS